jgi:hypothetical protein
MDDWSSGFARLMPLQILSASNDEESGIVKEVESASRLL